MVGGKGPQWATQSYSKDRIYHKVTAAADTVNKMDGTAREPATRESRRGALIQK